jgi:hypothetical protein
MAKAYEQQNDPEKFQVIRFTSIYLSALDFVILMDHVTPILLACSPSISNHAYALLDLILVVTETYLEDQVFKRIQDGPTTVFYAVQSYKKRCIDDSFPQSLFNIVSRFKDAADKAMAAFGDPNLNTGNIMKLKNSIDWALINSEDIDRLQKMVYFKHFISRVRVNHFEGISNYKSASKLMISRQFQIYKYIEIQRAACYFSKVTDAFLGDSYGELLKMKLLLAAQEVRDSAWEATSFKVMPKASSSSQLRAEISWLSSRIPTEDGPSIKRKKLLSHQCRDGFEEDFDDDFVTPELLRQLEEAEEELASRVQTPLLELTEAQYDELNSAQDVLFAPVATPAVAVVAVAAESVIVPTAAAVVAAESVIVQTAAAVIAAESVIVPTAAAVIAAESVIVPTAAAVVAAESVIVPTAAAVVAAESVIVTTAAAVVAAEPVVTEAEKLKAETKKLKAETEAVAASAVAAWAEAVVAADVAAEAVAASEAAATAEAATAAAVAVASAEAATAAAEAATAVAEAVTGTGTGTETETESDSETENETENESQNVHVGAVVPGGVKRPLAQDQQQQQQQPAHKYYIVDPARAVIVNPDPTLAPDAILPTTYDDAIIVFAVPRHHPPRKMTIGGLTFTV